MQYAIIRTGGKQYRVSQGETIEVERLKGKANDTLVFSDVLLYVSDGDFQIGKPLLTGITVSATIVDHAKAEKIRVAKYKAKVRFRRVTGHRQHITRVKIDGIDTKSVSKKVTTNEETKIIEKKQATKSITKKSIKK